MNIKTEFVYPPIPIRSFDWCAYDDDTYDGPGSLIGQGATEEAAIADFKEQWEERHGVECDHIAELRQAEILSEDEIPF